MPMSNLPIPRVSRDVLDESTAVIVLQGGLQHYHYRRGAMGLSRENNDVLFLQRDERKRAMLTALQTISRYTGGWWTVEQRSRRWYVSVKDVQYRWHPGLRVFRNGKAEYDDNQAKNEDHWIEKVAEFYTTLKEFCTERRPELRSIARDEYHANGDRWSLGRFAREQVRLNNEEAVKWALALTVGNTRRTNWTRNLHPDKAVISEVRAELGLVT